MMSKLFSSFTKKKKLTPQQEFQDILLQSTLFENSPTIYINDATFLINCFQELGPKFKGKQLGGKECMKLFLDTIQIHSNTMSQMVEMKILFTIHIILNDYEIGQQFAECITRQGNFLQCARNQEHTFNFFYFMLLSRLVRQIKIFYSAKVGFFAPMENKESNKESYLKQVCILQKRNNLQSKKQTFIAKSFESTQKIPEMSQQNYEVQSQFEEKFLIIYKLINFLNNDSCQIQDKIMSDWHDKELDNLFSDIGYLIWGDSVAVYKFICTEVRMKIINIDKFVFRFNSLSMKQIQQVLIKFNKFNIYTHVYVILLKR